MAYLILPSRRTRQPQGFAAINRSLVLPTDFVFNGAVPVVNYANGSQITTSSLASQPSGATSSGIGWQFVDAGSEAAYTGRDTLIAPTGFTFSGQIQGLNYGSAISVMARCGTGGGQGFWIAQNNVSYYASGDAPLKFRVTYFGVADYDFNANTQVALNRTVGFCIVGKTGSIKLFIDGAFIQEIAAGTYRAPSGEALQIGNPDATLNVCRTRWSSSVMLGRPVNDQLAASLSFSPWPDILAPDPRRLYFASGGTGATAYTLDAQPGGYTVSGTAATLARGIVLDAQPATYTVSGTAATLVRGYTLDAQPGSYTATGTAASLVKGYVVSASPATFTLTGVDATLEKVTPGVYTLDAQPGTYSLTGVAATLTYTPLNAYTLDAQPGSYTITGIAAELTYAGASIWTDVGVSAATWSDVGGATSIWTDL